MHENMVYKYGYGCGTCGAFYENTLEGLGSVCSCPICIKGKMCAKCTHCLKDVLACSGYPMYTEEILARYVEKRLDFSKIGMCKECYENLRKLLYGMNIGADIERVYSMIEAFLTATVMKRLSEEKNIHFDFEVSLLKNGKTYIRLE